MQHLQKIGPAPPVGPPTTPTPLFKMFNCVVDDTALIGGVKRSTRDGIRKWVANGSIRLYVPLHTLSRLDHLKKEGGRSATKAQETLTWLDEITSDQAEGRVRLEGGEELYGSWAEVERFMLPETLLSMESSMEAEMSEDEALTDDMNGLHVEESGDKDSSSSNDSIDLRSKTHTPSSPRSAYSSTTCSPGLNNATPHKEAANINPVETTRNGCPMHKKTNSSTSSKLYNSNSRSFVPKGLRPLFNHLLWRINNENSPADSFILLTNDQLKQRIAQRFGIRAKRLEQLRDIIAREERDQRNRMQVLKKEADAANKPVLKEKENIKEIGPKDSASESGDDEEEVVFKGSKPTPKPADSVPSAPTNRVVDPNAFSRATLPKPSPQSPSQSHGPGYGRGGRGSRFGSLRGAPGRGGFAPRNGLVNVPRQDPPRQAPVDLNQPIDPDSFDRPLTSRVSRGGGGGRRLWEPT